MERRIGQDFQNAEKRQTRNRTFQSRKRLRKDHKRDMNFACICDFFFYCSSFRSGSWRDFSGLISKVTLVR